MKSTMRTAWTQWQHKRSIQILRLFHLTHAKTSLNYLLPGHARLFKMNFIIPL